MSCYEPDWEDERVDRQAVLKLIERHRAEYDELAGIEIERRITELQRQVADALRQIEGLRAMNPDGVNAPALTETANALVAENDGLRDEQRKLERKIERLTKENRKLRELVADA